MTDRHQFSKLSEAEALWNVTLLPLPARRRTQSLENLDVRRSDAAGAQIVTLRTSFESQLKATG
jgi:hypothetical protein